MGVVSPAPVNSPDPAPADGASRRVLVIEDDPAIRRLLEVLMRTAGYEVETHRDGEEGWRRLGLVPAVDLVLLDLMLPGLSGEELLGRLRETPPGSRPAVLVLSARDAEDVQPRLLDLGASAFLNKPFDPAVLIDRVQALLS